MKELEQQLREQYKAESDSYIFGDMAMNDKLKQSIRERAGIKGGGVMTNMQADNISPVSGKDGKSKRGTIVARYRWLSGIAAAALVMTVAISAPQLFTGGSDGGAVISNPGSEHGVITEPGDGSHVTTPGGEASGGTSLSPLVTVEAGSTEEAKGLFGNDLLAPSFVPEGFQLSKIEATGMKEGEKAAVTRVVYFYQSGEREFTYMIDRAEAVIPMEFFSESEVSGTKAYVFAQPNMTELYWKNGGLQFSVVGGISEEESLTVAESLQ
ncbi:hypothetical protein A7K91_18830 [Paenibacillus oryzae]|uniref:DUF4367 domain-containing protein n=1 Tax=Paenibacillus oryzae TaxID=1844972 RepID=A0A1A5YQU1_9BACL|nr:DUF4367 domain-containing protein [Paenibacillus oryzae]OBR67987.1 hypothetical protein A7K91_18830 [Paenibacillus oryzae]